MRNIELKVRSPALDVVRRRAGDLGARYEWTRRDTDTYFRAPHGRLKFRETEGSPTGMLISYERLDAVSSRISQYQLLTVHEPERLREMLAAVLGVMTVVRKVRELYVYGDTRIHLDSVDGLGTFVELETVLGDQPMDDAQLEHEHVRQSLQLDDCEPVPVSYSDLRISAG
jgi:adenylate cyclase, class 2